METKRFIFVVLAVFLTILISACVQEEPPAVKTPEVNDENCKFENLKLIKDKAVREELASLCIRRGSFRPSVVKTW